MFIEVPKLGDLSWKSRHVSCSGLFIKPNFGWFLELVNLPRHFISNVKRSHWSRLKLFTVPFDELGQIFIQHVLRILPRSWELVKFWYRATHIWIDLDDQVHNLVARWDDPPSPAGHLNPWTLTRSKKDVFFLCVCETSEVSEIITKNRSSWEAENPI